MEQEDGGMNPTRRTVAGHTDNTEPLPYVSSSPEVDGRMAHVRADSVSERCTRPNLYIGGVEVTELADRLEVTAKVLTDMAEALRKMEGTRRSM